MKAKNNDLRTLRLSLGLTQSQMAARLWTNRRSYVYYEAGERKVPGPIRLLLLLIQSGKFDIGNFDGIKLATAKGSR